MKCYFDWKTEYKDAEQEVINRLQFVQLPTGLQAQLSPWNAIGEVFRYRVVGKGYTLKDLKTAQDWILERQFKQVQGVIDVTSYGGETKQYHVEVDPYRLRGARRDARRSSPARFRTRTRTSAAIASSWASRATTCAASAFWDRGLGAERDIENIVVAEQKGTPVRVRDVADVDIGNAPRLGIVGYDDEPDIVQGIVLMRYGGETQPTLEGIHAKVDYIRAEPHPAAGNGHRAVLRPRRRSWRSRRTR